jgi:hypothetical protein
MLVVKVVTSILAEEFFQIVGFEDLAGRAVAQGLLVEAENVGGIAINDLEFVGDENHGELVVGFQGVDELVNGLFAGDVDATGGFVKEEDVGLIDERPGDEDPLEFTAGKVA